MPARSTRRRLAGGVGRREQRLHAASRRRRRSGTRRRGSAAGRCPGPPEVSSHGSNVNESRCAAPAQGRVAQRHGRAGQRGRHLRAPGVPDRPRQRPRADRAERPGRASPPRELGDALGQLGQRAVRACGRAAGARRTPRARGPPRRRVRAVGDQPGRRRLAVDVEVLAVPVEDLPVDRVDRRARAGRGGSARTRGRRPRRRRSPHRAPRWCGPASRTRRCRTGRAAPPGSALGFSVPSGCIHSTTLPAFGAGRRSAGRSAPRSISYAASRLLASTRSACQCRR